MYPLSIQSEVLHATLLPRGASLVGLRFGQNSRNLVLGFAVPEDHTNVPVYAGALVGPVANRIEGGRITLDGIGHQMPRNEAGQTTLHSGPEGLHAHDWDVACHDVDQIVFTTTLSEGACGLPGLRKITAGYRLSGPILTLAITAKTTALTPMNIAAHPYWNLDGRPDVAEHTLQLPTDRYLPTGPDNLPTGIVARATDGPFNFTTPKAIALNPDLDVNYCLSDTPHPSPCHAATLTGGDGTRLDIATTAPGLQVYNGAHLPNLPAALQRGRDLRPYGGIALEPQHWPNAPHHPHFPQIHLRPDDTYAQITTYTLTAP